MRHPADLRSGYHTVDTRPRPDSGQRSSFVDTMADGITARFSLPRTRQTAAAVRQVWTGPRHTALAEAVVASPAFPALAWRLHELDERGYAFADVLGRIDPDRLMGPAVRDPAALAEWFVEQMASDLRVVNLVMPTTRPPPPPGPHRLRTRRLRQQVRPPGRAHPTRPTRPTPARAVRPRLGSTAAAAAQEAVVQPLLTAAYPPDLVQRLQHSRGYPSRERAAVFPNAQPPSFTAVEVSGRHAGA